MGETCLYEFHPSGWLRASALTCRSISLDGMKWSCLRINETPLSPEGPLPGALPKRGLIKTGLGRVQEHRESRKKKAKRGGALLYHVKTWGIEFNSPGSSVVAFLYRGRQCGLNTKHQTTKSTVGKPPLPCMALGRIRSAIRYRVRREHLDRL